MSYQQYQHGGRERQRCLEILGLRDPVSEDDVKKAYKQAALAYHPDKNKSPDAKGKFQEANTAYNYLIKGNSYMEDAVDNEDDVLIFVFQHLFPWMFEQGNNSQSRGYRTNSRQGNRNSSRGNNSGGFSHFGGGGQASYSHFEGFNPFSGVYGSSRGTPPRRGYADFYADSDSSEEESSGQSRPSTGGVPPTMHGQYFHEQAERRGAKKRNRNAKRAQKAQADENRGGQPSQPQTYHHNYQTSQPNQPSQPSQQRQQESNSESTSWESSKPPAESNPYESVHIKKSNKQIKAEQRQREKEAAEVREQLERMEIEKKEKLERKRAAEEERILREQERREVEERRIEEETRQREEQRRRQNVDDERRRRLMAEFDRSDFMDSAGDFKAGRPDLGDSILRGDINCLGNAKKEESSKSATINGFSPADLIRVQRAEDEKRRYAEEEQRQRQKASIQDHEPRTDSARRPLQEQNGRREDSGYQNGSTHPKNIHNLEQLSPSNDGDFNYQNARNSCHNNEDEFLANSNNNNNSYPHGNNHGNSSPRAGNSRVFYNQNSGNPRPPLLRPPNSNFRPPTRPLMQRFPRGGPRPLLRGPRMGYPPQEYGYPPHEFGGGGSYPQQNFHHGGPPPPRNYNPRHPRYPQHAPRYQVPNYPGHW